MTNSHTESPPVTLEMLMMLGSAGSAWLPMPVLVLVANVRGCDLDKLWRGVFILDRLACGFWAGEPVGAVIKLKLEKSWVTGAELSKFTPNVFC